ncbi:MAG: hypothetical protein HYT98_04500 [Candidatus Sungbacteria bacterium]|nr:hypothetical protein [Candidatus Sungbacteria bacterium]
MAHIYNKNYIRSFIFAAISLFLPLAAYAQNVDAIIGSIRTTANLIIALLFILATLVFLFGLVKFIASADDPAARSKSHGLMLWGIVGMAVMAAAWGLAYLLVTYVFGAGGGQTPTFVSPPAIN